MGRFTCVLIRIASPLAPRSVVLPATVGAAVVSPSPPDSSPQPANPIAPTVSATASHRNWRMCRSPRDECQIFSNVVGDSLAIRPPFRAPYGVLPIAEATRSPTRAASTTLS